MLWRRQKDFFSNQEEQEIILAIRQAERKSSGEIRVHVQHVIELDVLQEAIRAFERLKMDETEHRNGVIFFIVPESKEFAIYGDEGINDKVPEGFWEEVRNTLQTHFRQEAFVEGLVNGIELAGEKLKQYFPIDPNDTNELSDDISYS